MKSIRISVVIPTYKRPLLLMRCINALLHQDYSTSNFEIIVISDGEDDATREVIDSAGFKRFPVIRYYELPRRSGPAAARNLGWVLAQAELVAFTDDDCIPAPTWLAALWSAYVHAEAVDVAFAGSTEVPIMHNIPTYYERHIYERASGEFIAANCAATRSALQRVNGFDERFRMAWREDSDLQFRFILQQIPIIKVAGALVRHPVRKVPWGVSLTDERKRMFNALLYKKHPDLYREKIETDTPWDHFSIVFFLLVLFAGFVMAHPVTIFTGLAGWLVLSLWFAARRLRSTSHSWDHISEMMFTSAVLPVISIFWKLYGSLKFRVFRIL